MLRSLLNLRNAAQVRRIVEVSDGFGGLSQSTIITTIGRCSIWQPGSGDATLSDKITKTSTHILAMEWGYYSFNDTDREVIYNGHTYNITGHSDNVAERGELLLVGLAWQS
jgi:hypothetical protein